MSKKKKEKRKKKKQKFGYCSESARLKREQENCEKLLKDNERKIDSLHKKYPQLSRNTVERMFELGEFDD